MRQHASFVNKAAQALCSRQICYQGQRHVSGAGVETSGALDRHLLGGEWK